MTRGYTVHHLVSPGTVRIIRDADGTWAVYGHEAERATAVDGTDQEGRRRAEAQLRLLGVAREVALAGATPGDLVRVGRLEFECVAPDVPGERSPILKRRTTLDPVPVSSPRCRP